MFFGPLILTSVLSSLFIARPKWLLILLFFASYNPIYSLFVLNQMGYELSWIRMSMSSIVLLFLCFSLFLSKTFRGNADFDIKLCNKEIYITVCILFFSFLGDGTWNFHSGHCACMAGYEADTTSQSCKACPVGRFKHSSGDGPCLICPPHSQALYTGSVECSCTDGYYRAPGDARTAACTRPPGSPQDLTYRWLDQTTLLLKW